MAKSHGGSIIGNRLASHGVSHMFTLCGGHISPILTGSEDAGIDIVDVRDEKNAVFAADAVARMTGIPGVAAVTAGPGVTNTVTAVKNAQLAESPVIILGGATATILKGRGALQDIDQMSLMKSVTKWHTRVTKISSLAPTIDKAVEVATGGVPGPVFIEIPVDLLYEEDIVRGWYVEESGVDKMSGPAGKAMELYLKGHLARLFSAPHLGIDLDLDLDMESIESALPYPPNPKKQLERAARAYERSEKPVLVVGNQAMVNMKPHRARLLAESIEALGMPVFLGGSARGLLGRFSDIQFRHKRTKALRGADYVIVAGFPFDFRMGYGRKINSDATLVSANLSPKQLRKNRIPDIPAQTHPGEFLIELANRVSPRNGAWDDWFDELHDRESARDAEIATMAEDRDELVNPMYFFERMEEHLADDSVLVVDGGDFVATGAYILRPRGPLSWLDPGVFGTLGVGGGFALGAGLIRPDAEIWIVWGDGSSAYSLAEFDTYVRFGLAPIAVIGTDASWAQIAREQVEILGTPLGTELRRTEYHKVAEGYGGEGILVTDNDDIDEALEKAKKLSAEGTPVVVNLHLAESDFRKGSISM
jgi:acetolactate synthase-1/2/3 large subunit